MDPLPPSDSPDLGRRQTLLRLWLGSSDLNSAVVAWALHDPAAPAAVDDLPEKPPYRSAIAAVADGWRVLSVAPKQPSAPGHEHRLSFLPNEILLEHLPEFSHV